MDGFSPRHTVAGAAMVSVAMLAIKVALGNCELHASNVAHVPIADGDVGC